MSTQTDRRRRGAILFAVAVVAAAWPSLFVSGGRSAGPTSGAVVVAADMNPAGNAARTVGAIDGCVSATVGQPVEIDIVVPAPGVPSERGLAAYQFRLEYDPSVVWITADDAEMLLAQAEGSNVVAIADPKPDNNGAYDSWAVDFGPAGIEPGGASESGPGVIARLTILPKENGVSPLNLVGVLLIDDASERISLEAPLSGAIHVGEPCGSQEQAATAPSPSASPADPEAPLQATATPASDMSPAGRIPAGGGTPPSADNTPTLVVSGLIVALSGAVVLAKTVRRQ